ncbi:ABC transporter [Altericroceibacterium spongiae]|uniref:ABC transporter n=1 Tax=Altericroceibacterium spongiae TaxID=2320269 RepID=A0A420EK88_9SPHN|nr:ABC-type transport auxiliary lipoprotein family protein [Altericroceibacterium spongiae]RKF21097.1 ABC transporter [Altericroceibacterium spongiae]
MIGRKRIGGALRGAAMASAALALAGCISFGEDPPDRLLTLTPSSPAPAGAAAEGTREAALAIMGITATQALDVNRVPVQVDDSSLAYLKDAFWVDKPAELFARLLSERIRSSGTRLVVDDAELQTMAATRLSGRITQMGFDVPTQSVIMRFDATLQLPDGQLLTRRFESVQPGLSAKADQVGPALNDAANDIAGQVAEWVG